MPIAKKWLKKMVFYLIQAKAASDAASTKKGPNDSLDPPFQ